VVGLGGGDSLACVGCDEGASGVSVGCVIICAGPGRAVAGAMGVAGADMGLTGLLGLSGLTGLTGDSTFVGLVTDLTQVFDDVTQEPQAGCP